jgi:hypothetical protein
MMRLAVNRLRRDRVKKNFLRVVSNYSRRKLAELIYLADACAMTNIGCVMMRVDQHGHHRPHAHDKPDSRRHDSDDNQHNACGAPQPTYNTGTSATTVLGGTGSVTINGGSGGGPLFGGSSGNNVISATAGNSTLVGGGTGGRGWEYRA